VTPPFHVLETVIPRQLTYALTWPPSGTAEGLPLMPTFGTCWYPAPGLAVESVVVQLAVEPEALMRQEGTHASCLSSCPRCGITSTVGLRDGGPHRLHGPTSRARKRWPDRASLERAGERTPRVARVYALHAGASWVTAGGRSGCPASVVGRMSMADQWRRASSGPACAVRAFHG
jgi:hypothetical protein